ncbi:hypothetical protein [Belliella aquatica]|uniref:Site-specific DNA-methyltransferase (adenine-specific) n=1 Tax=Belliella aquatica TaxID=1323734 RepID=A0ABQ1MAX9_9BACT|nr:hypothetical protein [Belliella aquatica]MCH7406318.1 hypothetical protein [Belliella aquatica]GGC37823.1 hypothetical protein GCM10010993_15900 [Belliella aquatica]
MSNFIPSEHTDKTILRYDLLFEEGLKHAQKFSGKIWTDYNYHDPGVTFLEYLCYALTDLGYRTDFPIADLFLFGKDDFNNVKENLLFGPAEVFNSSPSTINDYRKLIIDRIKLVANAWVIPIKDHRMGLKGLFEIFIECSEDLTDLELQYLKNEVTDLFHQNRLIGHDLEQVWILKKVYLSIEAEISIESDALGELVMAKIYTALDSYINPQVELHDPIKLWKEAGYGAEQVLNGPLPMFGFIFDHELTPKIEAIYISRIKELILEVEGVKEINQLVLLKNGIPVFDNFVRFSKDEFPKIQYLDELTDTFQSFIHLLKNNVKYDIDPIITKQLITSEGVSVNQYYHQELRYEEKLPEGRFSLEELRKHYPIHNELPELYGVGKFGVSKNSGKVLQSSTYQVSAYLYFFEQMMASYLAQLSGLRFLFSTRDLKESYYNQIPLEIPLIQNILPDTSDFLNVLHQCSQISDDFVERRNRLLDHLLARFGEKIDETSLKKIYKSATLDGQEHFNLPIIQTKMSYLNEIIEIGRNKSKAFDLKGEQVWDAENISGLEKRIAIALNIKNYQRRYLSAPLKTLFTKKSEPKDKELKWMLQSLSFEEGEFQVYKLPQEAYQNRMVHFYGKGLRFLQEIFQITSNKKKIYTRYSPNEDMHYLMMQQSGMNTPFILYESSISEDCIIAKAKIIDKLNDLDEQSEGFHMLEHILLRPLEPVSFIFSFLNFEGEEFIEGLYPGEMEEQKSLGEDLLSYGIDIDNYSIVEQENTNTYAVLIYNYKHEPFAKIKGTFNSKPGAKRAIDNAMNFFNALNVQALLPENFMEVNHMGGAGHGFPQNFPFSDTLSFIFPNWPARFQKNDFKKYLEKLVAEHVMAHQGVKIYFLNMIEIEQFEERYHQWLFLKNQDQQDLKKIDGLALQLIQLLQEFKSINFTSGND